MTRAQLRAYTLQLLDDIGPGIEGGYFNDQFMLPALNRGQEEVQKQLVMAGELYYYKEVQTSTVQDQADYIWPVDLLKIHTIELVLSGSGVNENKVPVTPVTLNSKYSFPVQTGVPQNYFLKKDRFTLLPTPDNTYTLKLGYSYKIADLTSDSQTPDIPEEYQKMIGVYAAIEGKVKDNSDASNLYGMKQEFENNMKQMAMDRQYQQPRMVIETDYDGGWQGW